ncbi:hypothetical protein NDU88_007521 [Pleurodeles waltl]|uniref:Uncharacterized protein n=1 Tax=Pleurodeles waltl TaxID=8319 RepID=A0AAV7RS54_PLEWA|nr:hypothetical protein NDU88_007521 [Pleurodeles waltl]
MNTDREIIATALDSEVREILNADGLVAEAINEEVMVDMDEVVDSVDIAFVGAIADAAVRRLCWVILPWKSKMTLPPQGPFVCFYGIYVFVVDSIDNKVFAVNGRLVDDLSEDGAEEGFSKE